MDVSPQTREDLSVNDEGEVDLPDEFVIGRSQKVFGDKIYGEITDTLAQKTEEIVAAPATTEQQQVERLQMTLMEQI